MNYNREFAGKPPLPKQPMVTELKNPYTLENLSQATVSAYNRYTEEFNRTRYRATQEFLLDQRHRFFCAVLDIQN